MKDYIYLYGQILATQSFVLDGAFPKPDKCANIKESNFHVGGETGTASIILASLGEKVKVGGTHIGGKNTRIIQKTLQEKNVDASELVFDAEFGGIVDYVFISGSQRTCFGEWGNIYSRKEPWYEPVNEESIRRSICVGFDPLLNDSDMSVTDYCIKHGKKYAAIDCPYDSEFNKYCEINAISHEYLKGKYGEDADFYELHKKYTENSDGLIIFTFGENEVLYGRKNEEIKTFHPYQVKTVSTLGAGDSFKAGTIYALSKRMPDDKIVQYASAVAGVAITKYPISENPPVLQEVEELIASI